MSEEQQIVYDRESGGERVHLAWISWALMQPDPKPSWLLPWEDLDEASKEADRVIWEQIATPYIETIRRKNGQLDFLYSEIVDLEEDIYEDGWPDL